MVTPVTFSPGLLRLVTSPLANASPPVANTIGMLAVAALAARAENFGANSDHHTDLPPHEVDRQCWQPLRMTVRRAVFNCNVLAFHESYLLKPLAKGGNPFGVSLKGDSI